MGVDGDLCMCKCPVPPRLIASQHSYSMAFSAKDIASTSGAAAWLARAGGSLAAFGYRFDRYVVLKDKSGSPHKNMPYRISLDTGQVFEGVTDDAGRTEKVFSTRAQTATIEVPYYGNTDDTAHAAHGPDACGC